MSFVRIEVIVFVKYVENSATSSGGDLLVNKEISLDLFNTKLNTLNKHLWSDLDSVTFSQKKCCFYLSNKRFTRLR